MHLFSTNIAYNLKNNCIFQLPFSSRTPLAFSSDQKQVCLLGKSYTQDSRDMLYNDFEKIIWFSYRRLEQFEDVGWGCMIRVIQMLVAQAITRDQTDMHPDKIIDLFREEKEGPLALSKICKAGQIGNFCLIQELDGPVALKSCQLLPPSFLTSKISKNLIFLFKYIAIS